MNRTPLFDSHVFHGARLVDFSGWEMPLHYGSQIDEHRMVRSGAGLLDVSHMLAIDVTGMAAETWLLRMLANDVRKLGTDGRALYSCLLNERGGVIDDLIVYRRSAQHYRLVVNAGTAQKDLIWLTDHLPADDGVSLQARRDLAMIAIQGPTAQACFGLAFPALKEAIDALGPFSAAVSHDWMIGRTGYTGEDGLEIMLPAAQAAETWAALIAAGARPAGLGARDTLRLEAGMNLYGQDMDEDTMPLEAGLTWTIAMTAGHDFVGRNALEAARPIRRLAGLVLLDRGVLRAHQQVQTPLGTGEITSGTFSPTMGRAIGLARLPAGTPDGDIVTVDLRGKPAQARVVKPPFVRNGRILITGLEHSA